MHQKNPVKAMEGIQAKQNRLAYIRKNFPALENKAKKELLMACIYSMQSTKKDLSGDARKRAMNTLRTVIMDLQPMDFSDDEAGKRKLLMQAACRCPVLVSGVLNVLIDLHVLT